MRLRVDLSDASVDAWLCFTGRSARTSLRGAGASFGRLCNGTFVQMQCIRGDLDAIVPDDAVGPFLFGVMGDELPSADDVRGELEENGADPGKNSTHLWRFTECWAVGDPGKNSMQMAPALLKAEIQA